LLSDFSSFFELEYYLNEFEEAGKELVNFSSFFELEYYLNEFEEAGKELVEIKL
jgi:hypothetical protein